MVGEISSIPKSFFRVIEFFREIEDMFPTLWNCFVESFHKNIRREHLSLDRVLPSHMPMKMPRCWVTIYSEASDFGDFYF